jgi:hypothetical protein
MISSDTERHIQPILRSLSRNAGLASSCEVTTDFIIII